MKAKASPVFFAFLFLLIGGSLSWGDVSVRQIAGFKTKDGVTVKTFRLQNDTSRVIDCVALSLHSAPMGYFGLDADHLSIFPSGTGTFYLEDREGGFLLPRQKKDIQVFQRGGGGAVASVVSGIEGVAEKMIDEGEVDVVFGSYTPQAKESFRDFSKTPKAWRELVDKSSPTEIGDGARGVFLQTLISGIIEEIGVAIGDTINAQKMSGDIIAQREAETSFVQAQKAYDMGDLNQAESLLRRALSYSPNDSLIQNNLGYVMFLIGDDVKSARDYIEQALKAEPDNPYYLASLAEVLWQEGDRENGIKLLRRAHGLDSDGGAGTTDLLEKWEKGDGEGSDSPNTMRP
jgi:hypothetical protein